MQKQLTYYRDASSKTIARMQMPDIDFDVTFYEKGCQKIFFGEIEQNQKDVERLFVSEAIAKGYSFFISHAAEWVISYVFFKNRTEENKKLLLSLVWDAYRKELREWYKMELIERELKET